MCALIKLNFPFLQKKSLFDVLSNVYQTDVWSVCLNMKRIDICPFLIQIFPEGFKGV